jgi:hypothetical protein
MSRGLTAGLAVLRGGGVLALLLLLWNPTTSRDVPDPGQPLVLLDASLSMGGLPGETRWPSALDTARALAHGGIVWRFGAAVASFDSGPPGDGASRLRPAVEAGAARGGELTVVTDGAISDLDAVPADLRRRPRIVVLPRAPFRDAFVASVEGSRHVAAGDTLRLAVTFGTAGPTPPGRADERPRLEIRLGERVLAGRAVTLPDSGVVSAELELAASRLPPGWSALQVGLAGARDVEPRDDARAIVVEVGPQPAAVVLAAPPDWDARFFARTLTDVARVPLRSFVEPGDSGGWRDGATLAPVGDAAVQRAVDSARLVVLAGSPERLSRVRVPPRAALVVWPTVGRPSRDGDWYVDPPPASPIAGPLAGVRWDSLPPVVSLAPMALDSTAITVLTARLARRGSPEPVVVLGERGGRRQASIAGQGLYRWSFRGGAAAEAYRALVAGVADWLLAPAAAGRERAVPTSHETPQGLPLVWRWTGAAPAQPLVADLQSSAGALVDTLRFDVRGQAEQRLPPGVYRYALRGGRERGVVVVEEYSDEWRPAVPVVGTQDGTPSSRREAVGWRDRWWLYVLAVAAFAAEWAWRRRQGLP